MKQACTPAELCKNCPAAYEKYLNYCNKLEFDEPPDYGLLKGLILESAAQNGCDLEERNFDWQVKLQILPGFSSGSNPGKPRI